MQTTAGVAPATSHQMVLDHLPMVRAMAKRYAWCGSYADLVQEGTLGLLRAAQKYDPSRGTTFGTYARWWVRAHLQRHVRRAGTVPLPETRSIRRVRNWLTSTTRRLENATSGAVSDADIAAELGVDAEEVARVRSGLRHANGEMSACERGVGAYEPDRVPPCPETLLGREELRETARRLVREQLAHLAEREQLILTQRRMADRRRTLQELGEQLSLSGERVRQLEKRAMQRLVDGLRESGCLPEARHCAAELARV